MSSSEQHPTTAAVTSDPTLDISHQHNHQHHGGAADFHSKEEPVYAHGALPEDNTAPPQFSHKDIESGVVTEKKGTPSTGDIEKGSRTGSGASVRSEGGGFYKKYKIYVHAFIFCLFTG